MRKKLLCILLALSLLTASAAAVSWEDFPDSHDHWAAETLRRAVEDGILQGTDTGSLEPNGSLNVAAMVTVLTRTLDATVLAEDTGIDESAWYAEAANKALALGIIDSSVTDMYQPVTREMAFVAFANAFQLITGEDGGSALSEYKDASEISVGARAAASALVRLGVIQGSYGYLNPQQKLSRAEFVTMLYRVAGTYISDSTVSSLPEGGVVLTGERVTMQNVDASGIAVLDSGVKSAVISSVSGDGTVVLRSDRLENLTVYGNTSIRNLVLANMSGDITYPYGYGANIGRLVVARGSGKVTVSGAADAVDVTGDGRTVTMSNAAAKTVTVLGDNCTVTLTYAPETLVVSGSGNTVTVSGGTVARMDISGKNNAVTLNCKAADVTLSGAGSRIEGSGSIDNAIITTPDYTASVPCGNMPEDAAAFDGAELLVVQSGTPVEGGEVKVQAALSVSGRPVKCDYQWFVDGKSVGSGKDFFACDGAVLDLSYTPTYSKDMKTDPKAKLMMSYVNQDGETEQLSAETTLAIKNHSEDYYNRLDPQKVLKQVGTEYVGNYTLAWALEHDYAADVKEVWVNAKGYSSRTDYLIWINKACQHVNIFKGSQGEWELIRSNVVGTGSMNRQTPVGVTYVTYRDAHGWWTSTYVVHPVVGFYPGSGYAFHSRLYYPSGSGLSDASIGYPISHGCVRMYDEDVQWIYDNIPLNTTVVIY